MKPVFAFSILLFSLQSFAMDPPCDKPAADQVVYRCEKILSLPEKFPPGGRLKRARFRVWLQKVGEGQGLCVDGFRSETDSLEPGKSVGMGEPAYPFVTKKTNGMWSMELVITSDSWRLIETNEPQVLKAYPKYPKVIDKYRMDLKNLEFSVADSTLDKSMATLKLGCEKESPAAN